MITVLPVFLSRTVMVPLSSSVETTSTSGFAAAIMRVIARAGYFLNTWAPCLALCAIKYIPAPATSAARTTSAPQPPRIQTTALVFCGAEALTGGTGADAGGVAGGAAPPACGPVPGLDGALAEPAVAPQLPQNGPCTWAPQLVQNAISPPGSLRYENRNRLASNVTLCAGTCAGSHPRTPKKPKEFIVLRRILY